ncbi:MAG: ectoine/hydroxyectoine ABC transporter permease subunit EhuC [Gammaproteobacteria bacterium]
MASFAEFRQYLPELLRGLAVTVKVTLGGAVLAVAAAFTAGLGKLYAPQPLRGLASAYIEVFRGTSALVQMFWLFFVLPHFGVTLEPLSVGILALGLNVGAYGAEMVRGAIGGVTRGQWEAATALNMSRAQALRRVILPQAVVAMIPPWGNLFIELLKATSLVSLITLADLTFKAQQINQQTLRTTEVFTLVLLAYLALSVLITVGMRALERHLARGLRRGRTA